MTAVAINKIHLMNEEHQLAHYGVTFTNTRNYLSLNKCFVDLGCLKIFKFIQLNFRTNQCFINHMLKQLLGNMLNSFVDHNTLALKRQQFLVYEDVSLFMHWRLSNKCIFNCLHLKSKKKKL